MLTDAAFDSGQTFAAELATDNHADLQQLADDFWRTHIVAQPALAQVLAENGDTPGRLAGRGAAVFVQTLSAHPKLSTAPHCWPHAKLLRQRGRRCRPIAPRWPRAAR